MAFNALRNLFGKAPQEAHDGERTTLVGPRIPRHSTGWSAMLKHLKEEESLRVLDIGPTSSSNINFLTDLGHSIYMADVVTEAERIDWSGASSEEASTTAGAVESFFAQHMNFGDRIFDVVLLWTTLDYLPEPLLAPMISRLHANLGPKARVLAFFHTKTTEDPVFYRYHVTAADSVEMQEAARRPVRRALTNRKIEQMFSAYQGCKFFLAKDNVYEVIVTR